MTTYEYKTCPLCGIQYAVDAVVMNYKEKLPVTDENRSWHCPNGHSLIYTESLADKYRRDADRLRQQLAQRDDEIRSERRRAEKAEKATRLLKKRTAAGTCPCCQRTFSNMSTHMRKQHPDFVKDAAGNVVPLKAKA